jgi:hypothetical protein
MAENMRLPLVRFDRKHSRRKPYWYSAIVDHPFLWIVAAGTAGIATLVALS